MLEEVTEPQVLMTEVLPSFTKITTILDYVNSNKNVNLREKLQKKEKLKVAENLNILGSCKEKISQTIFMRYMKHPTTVTVPFL